MIFLFACVSTSAPDPSTSPADSRGQDSAADSAEDSAADSDSGTDSGADSDTSGGTDSGTDSQPDTGDPAPDDWDFLRDIDFENVIIVDVDTMRADHLPFYGYARDTTPLLSTRSGVAVMRHHRATGGWTPPAVASLLTGLEPWQHRVIAPVEGWGTLNGESWAIPLDNAGVATRFFNANGMLVETDLLQSWRSYQHDVHDTSGDLEADLLGWIDGLPAGQPFLAILQPMEIHQPWQPMAEDMGVWSVDSTLPMGDLLNTQTPYVEQQAQEATDEAFAVLKQDIIDVYDEEILSIDRTVSALLDGLEARGMSENTLVILTADHGETLFDADRTWGHAMTIREELLHIPLILFHPSLAGQEVDCMSSQADLIATLADLRGWPAPAGLAPRSLIGTCRQQAPTLHLLVDNQAEVPFMWGYEATAAGTRWRLDSDCAGGLIAYDLRSDPAMAVPLPYDPTEPALAELYDALSAYLDTAQAEVPTVNCRL